MTRKILSLLIVLASSGLLLLAIHTALGSEISVITNFTALTGSRSVIYGTCEETSNSCIFVCSVCGRKYEAVGSHKGPAGNVVCCGEQELE